MWGGNGQEFSEINKRQKQNEKKKKESQETLNKRNRIFLKTQSYKKICSQSVEIQR